MTTLTHIDIDYDKLLDTPTQKRVREMNVPEPDEEETPQKNITKEKEYGFAGKSRKQNGIR